MTLYVTNLPARATPADLAILFARYGRVAGAGIRVHPGNDSRRRVGVVEVHADGGAEPIRLDGVECRGLRLAVTLTRPNWVPPPAG